MSLNLKNKETTRLIQQLAQATGESLTMAVTVAVRERLTRLDRAQPTSLAKRLRTIGKDCALHLKEPFLSADHGDLLYDENGLPK